LNNNNGKIKMTRSEISLENRPFLKKLTFNEPFRMECGKTLPYTAIAYETYGKINNDISREMHMHHAIAITDIKVRLLPDGGMELLE
jgi:homoserine acetyltransferase